MVLNCNLSPVIWDGVWGDSLEVNLTPNHPIPLWEYLNTDVVHDHSLFWFEQEFLVVDIIVNLEDVRYGLFLDFAISDVRQAGVIPWNKFWPDCLELGSNGYLERSCKSPAS